MTPNMARAWFLLAMVNIGMLVGLSARDGTPALIAYILIAAAFAYLAGAFLRIAEDGS